MKKGIYFSFDKVGGIEKLIEDKPTAARIFGVVQKKAILVNSMRDEFFPFWYALFVHMMFKNLGNLCGSLKTLKT